MIRHWIRHHWVNAHWVLGHWIEREARVAAPASFQVPTSGDEGDRRYRWELGPVVLAEAETFATVYESLHLANGTVLPIWVHKKPQEMGTVHVCEWEGEVRVMNRPDAPNQYDVQSTFSERVRSRPGDGE